MSAPNYFAHAQGPITIGSHADFRIVHGDAITNNNSYQCAHAEDRVVVHGRRYRRIIDGDLVLQRQHSSKVISVTIKPEGGVSTSRTSIESQVVNVRRTTHTAEVIGFGGMFTATTFEPADENDESFQSVLECVLKAATSVRSPFLRQMFAFSGPNLSTLVAHDELADGYGFTSQFRGKNRVVYHYLEYTLWVAINSLRDDETVGSRWRDWSMNLKTLSWHYDPASVALDPPDEAALIPSFNHIPPLRQETLRHLNTAEIVACVEESLGDVLCLVASLEGRWGGDLSGYAKHGLLTFGAVVDRHNARILAHFPSTSPLEWFCQSEHPDVKASFSSSVPWRVDFSFRKPGNVRVPIEFGWRIPEKERSQHRAAYLCQSLPFLDGCEDVKDVAYINQVGFELTTTFHYDPTTSSTPAYLFVPPLPVEIINNMDCIQYPFPEPLFYWSHDPQGDRIIGEENWEEFGTPKLETKDWVGSYWEREEYNFVRDHLMSGNYNLDGRRYAREHGHPELIYADPHDIQLAQEHVQGSHSGTPTESSSYTPADDGSATGGLNHIEPVEGAGPDSQHKPNTLENPILLRRPTSLSEWLTSLEKTRATSRRDEEERAGATTRALKNLWPKYSAGSS
ncbi:hypothetical protein PQX77_022204 [Marasmius sp. AFHP31]|nr:hypothetical protein PQX77_022204 [Marasmius sp. AFHP31]